MKWEKMLILAMVEAGTVSGRVAYILRSDAGNHRQVFSGRTIPDGWRIEVQIGIFPQQ